MGVGSSPPPASIVAVLHDGMGCKHIKISRYDDDSLTAPCYTEKPNQDLGEKLILFLLTVMLTVQQQCLQVFLTFLNMRKSKRFLMSDSKLAGASSISQTASHGSPSPLCY